MNNIKTHSFITRLDPPIQAEMNLMGSKSNNATMRSTR